jgi:hypothetical protein
MEAIEVGLKLLSTKHDSWVWLCWDYRANQEDSFSSQAWEYAGKRSSWASLLASQHATLSDQRVSENMSNKPHPIAWENITMPLTVSYSNTTCRLRCRISCLGGNQKDFVIASSPSKNCTTSPLLFRHSCFAVQPSSPQLRPHVLHTRYAVYAFQFLVWDSIASC